MLLALALLSVAGLPTAAGTSDSSYRRAVAGALARAELELFETTDLWVDHSSWENAWEVSTENYSVRTTRSRYLAANVAEGLEVMLGHFQKVLATDFVPAEPFQILIFPSLTQYNQFGEQHGAEHSSALGSFFTVSDPRRPVATYFVENPTQLRMWITHSALHQFVDRAFQSDPPTAISEGLASYFMLYWDQQYAASEHNRLKDVYRPLESLLEESLPSYLNAPDERFLELGLFFTYLLHFREDTRMAQDGGEEPEFSFATYLRTIVRGSNASATSFRRLLANDLEAIEEDFRAFDFPR